MWGDTGISFQSAIEAGEFLISQGFTPCDGGFEKVNELNGGQIFASYVLTNRKCYVRVLDTTLAEAAGEWA